MSDYSFQQLTPSSETLLSQNFWILIRHPSNEEDATTSKLEVLTRCSNVDHLKLLLGTVSRQKAIKEQLSELPAFGVIPF